MSRKLVELEIKWPEWLETLKRSEKRIGLFQAAMLQTNRAQLFANEGAYNGHQKWAPLKTREGQILSLSGALKNSIAPKGATGQAGPGGFVQIGGNLTLKTARVGTKLKYAAMMNWGTTGLPGGVLTPKKGGVFRRSKVLRFKAGSKWVFAQSVKIPARRFDTFTSQDKREMTEAMTNLIAEILDGA